MHDITWRHFTQAMPGHPASMNYVIYHPNITPIPPACHRNKLHRLVWSKTFQNVNMSDRFLHKKIHNLHSACHIIYLLVNFSLKHTNSTLTPSPCLLLEYVYAVSFLHFQCGRRICLIDGLSIKPESGWLHFDSCTVTVCGHQLPEGSVFLDFEVDDWAILTSYLNTQEYFVRIHIHILHSLGRTGCYRSQLYKIMPFGAWAS